MKKTIHKTKTILISTSVNLLISTSILISTLSFAQAPQKMSYQAVIRNTNNNLVTNTTVGMQISILQGSSTGTAVYIETQTPTTNINGLATIEIGTGTIVTGTFSAINWASGSYYIKTETDPTGGTSYSITGNKQLISVPYALFSANGGTPGLIGSTGSNGNMGSTGATGNNGNIGSTGATGSTGFSGSTGSTGTTGLLSNGTTSGNTPYWDGTQWVLNSSNIYNAGGNIGIGTLLPSSMLSVGASNQFQIDNTGNIVSVNNITTSFPATQGLANQVLTNNGLGILTWAIPATVTTNANLTGDITSVGNATTLTNAPVIAKVLTGYVSGAGVVAATDNILQAIQKLNGNNATNANLTGMVTSIGNATTVVTNANLTGSVTSVGNAATVITNANLTGPITSVGNATSIASQTGTGSTFAMSVSPTFTGAPTLPTGTIATTQTPGNNTTAIATTAFVAAASTTLASPTASVGLSAIAGTAITAMRSDAAPILSQTIVPTWTGIHTFNNATYSALFTGGNVGINTSTPNATAQLHVDLGTSITKGVLVTGTYNASSTVPDLNAGSRMMFYPGKAAFRAGNVDGTQWNNANVGVYSTATGWNNTASGNTSTAMGYGSIASGDYSTAMGLYNTTSGIISTAMGTGNITSGDYSTAMGAYSKASGLFSTVMGYKDTASGDVSIARGYYTTAPSFDETVIGAYNTRATSPTAGSWVSTDRLFVVANGTSDGARSNAITVLKSGNVGINTSTPNATAALHVDLGTSITNGVLITGTYNASSTVPDLGAGSRMMFYPGKAAFRAGNVSGTEWNNTNVGISSTAMGYGCTASGTYSTAIGFSNVASGFGSTAIGYGCTASGNNGATAMGNNTTASGFNSTAIGTNLSTNVMAGAFIIGDASTGTTTNSSAIHEMTMRFAGGYRFFSDAGLTSANAMVFNAGKLGIGTSSPNTTAQLHVDLGTSITNGILITGTYNASSTVPDLGAGSRMMFYPGKAAFRAGNVSGTEWNNTNVGISSTAMGYSSIASGTYSTAIGFSNVASGFGSTALGYGTTASGTTGIAMGNNTTASGYASTAMGCNVSTNAMFYSFIIGDASTGTTTNSSANNEMTMRFAGGYRLFSNAGLTAGVTLAAGGGAWASVSDKRKKENFITLDPEDILLKIKNMPVTQWNYKAQDQTNHHIGPMAQDFYAAFKLSGIGNDTTITTIDIDGVNMIAIQALEKRTAQLKLAQDALVLKTDELEKLKAEVDNVKKENSEFKNQFIKLENELSAANEANKKVNSLLERLNKLERNTQESASAKK